LSHYSPATQIRISQRQRNDLRPTPEGWRFFPFAGDVPAGPTWPTLQGALAWDELAARRRFYKPAGSPIAPPIRSATGRAGELVLNEIPTVIFSADPPGPRAAIYEARRARMNEIMRIHNFKAWRFHIGATLRTDLPPDQRDCSPHCREHAELLNRSEPPLLVLEDDAEPAWVPTHFVPPANADRLHIGGDTHGVDLGRKLAWLAGKHWQRHKGYLWRPHSRDWFWEAGMLAWHAVLWLNGDAMRLAASYLRLKTGAVDAVCCELDGQLNVACPTRCWFWQNDGHNGSWSFDFVPPGLRHPLQGRVPP